MNSQPKSGKFPEGEFTSPEDPKKQGPPTGESPVGSKPGYEDMKAALEARL